MNSTLVLGVDIGGSHITTALVDVTNGTLLYESLVRRMVDSKASKEEVINAWCAAILPTIAALKNNTLIGIAMPGPFDYDNGISLIKEQPKYRSLYGENVRQLLADKLNIDGSQINFMNDASSFLQGEVLAGAAKGADEVIGITLGTGLGSAIHSNGSTEDAELWMTPFKSAMAEDFLSTRWFVQQYELQSGKSIKGVKELANLATADPLAKGLFEMFGKNLAEFLILMRSKYNCDTVVIGGNIANASHLFLESTTTALKNAGVDMNMQIGSLGETAAMVGAAGRSYNISRGANNGMSSKEFTKKVANG